MEKDMERKSSGRLPLVSTAAHELSCFLRTAEETRAVTPEIYVRTAACAHREHAAKVETRKHSLGNLD